MMWGYGPGMGVLMSIGTVLFLAAIAAGLVVLVCQLSRSGAGPAATAGPVAETILADRFARGEIDVDEYRARLATLRTPRPAS